MDGYRVLIVDDDPAIREGLPLLVDWAGEGFLVAGAAENGRRALELLQREPFDLLFTDIRMPVMDGLLLAGHAQALQRPPVVAILSAFGDFTYAQSAMRHGVRHHRRP